MAEDLRPMTTTTVLASLIGGLVGIVLTHIFHMVRASFEVRYARLYERRADAIDELHKRLVRTGEALGIWASPLGGFQEAQREEFIAYLQDFSRYYREQSLWLDNQTRQKLDAYFREVAQAVRMISDFTDKLPPEDWEEEHPMKKKEARTWLLEKTSTEFPKLEEQLRQDFREIIEMSDLRDRDAPHPWRRRVFGG